MYLGFRIGIPWCQTGGRLRPPFGFVFLIDNDGAYLVDNDGAYLVEAI